jgi:hypothetical protein
MNVTNGSDTLVFRSIFTEADYMGTAKPTAPTNIIVLVGRSGAVAQVASRNAADLNATLSNSDNNIAGLKLYPNPVSNGTLYIDTTANAEKTVAIFDILGKQVLNTTTNDNAVNVNALRAGVYLVKITEEGKTATRKLVIK